MTELAREPIGSTWSNLRFRRGFQLLVLTAVAMAGIYARTTLGPIQETMRLALALSDNQMALLQGAALAVPLSVAAIPLGMAIDRYSRVRILCLATALSLIGSLCTALSYSFSLLFLSRCLVGFAAPATAIAAFSVLADLFPAAQRGRATMAVVLGQSAGSSSAFALGGELLAVTTGDPDSWRWAMFAMAAFLAPVLILSLTLREPPRRDVITKSPPLREIAPALWRYRGILVVLLGAMCLVNLADGAVLVWAAPALARNFNLPPDRVGTIMAMALLVGGVSGPVVGGIVADVCQSSGGPRRTVVVLSLLALAGAPMSLFAVMPSVAWAIAPLVVFMALGTAISVMTTAVSIIVIPNELRGLCVSVKFAAAMFFGLGLAPLTVSLLSGSMGGPAMIGKALAVVCSATSILGAVTFVAGRRYFPKTLNPGDSSC
jgi:MFS family permease